LMDRFALHFSPLLPKECVRREAENIDRESFIVELNTFLNSNWYIACRIRTDHDKGV
jgi:hypothetical protein